jgi:NADH dehydrogenase FAD-containing subunit
VSAGSNPNALPPRTMPSLMMLYWASHIAGIPHDLHVAPVCIAIWMATMSLCILKLCRYNHKGSLAYVGGDQAVMDIPKVGPIFGTEAGILWKGYETFAQISLRNQLLVFNDWIRTKIFGRDISRV